MDSGLAKLLDLQQIDNEIHELDMSSCEFPERVAALEAEIREAADRISELETQLEESGKEKTAIAQEAEEARQALERSRTRLANIRTNREYDAVHSEIEAHEATIAGGKSRLESIEENRDKAEKEVAEVREQRDQLEKEHAPTLDELKEKIAAIDGKRQALVKKREAIAKEIPQRFLRTYEHIIKRRKSGQVLSFVSSDSRTCSVCHKVLEPQVINELRAGTRLNICQSCGSILAWKEEE
jgi:uncharacterized protein